MADPGLSWGGGGAEKIMCAHAHAHHDWGPGPLIRALEALGVLMVSPAIWALFLSILIQNGIRQNTVYIYIFWGGGVGGGCCAPSGSTTEFKQKFIFGFRSWCCLIATHLMALMSVVSLHGLRKTLNIIIAYYTHNHIFANRILLYALDLLDDRFLPKLCKLVSCS